MREYVKWHRIPAVVFAMALDMIPMIRDGKADLDAMTSFISDHKMLRAFKQRYMRADSKKEQQQLIGVWNYTMDCRESENYVPHIKSKHYSEYRRNFGY